MQAAESRLRQVTIARSSGGHEKIALTIGTNARLELRTACKYNAWTFTELAQWCSSWHWAFTKSHSSEFQR